MVVAKLGEALAGLIDFGQVSPKLIVSGTLKTAQQTSDVLERVEKQGDLYAPVLELEQSLPKFSELTGD